MKRIGAMPMELREGETWEDILSFTLTRQDAMMAMAAMSVMLSSIKENMDSIAQQANDGDIMAILVGPHLLESAKDLQGAMRSFVQQSMPDLWKEVEAQDAAEEAADYAKAQEQA
jgi:hypothetical protein